MYMLHAYYRRRRRRASQLPEPDNRLVNSAECIRASLLSQSGPRVSPSTPPKFRQKFEIDDDRNFTAGLQARTSNLPTRVPRNIGTPIIPNIYTTPGPILHLQSSHYLPANNITIFLPGPATYPLHRYIVIIIILQSYTITFY